MKRNDNGIAMFLAVGALVLVAMLLVVFAFVAPATASFGFSQFEVGFRDENGAPEERAGAHPYAMDTFFELKSGEQGGILPDGGDIRLQILEQVKGFAGNAAAAPRCSTIDFVTEKSVNQPSCVDSTAVGLLAVLIGESFEAAPAAIYNLTPPPGVPVRLGFVIEQVPVVIDVGVKQSPDYNVVARVANQPQVVTVFGAAVQIWGVPGDPAHDFARGECHLDAYASNDNKERIVEGKLNLKKNAEGGKECPAETGEVPLLTLPRACQGPLATAYELESWSGAVDKGSHQTPAFEHCGKLDFLPGIASRATTDSAETGSGLDFELDFVDEVDHTGEGLIEADGIAQSDLKKTVVTLPAGVTINPSIAAGLGVCTPADLERETIAANPGEGCPNASKIGTVSVETPLVEELVEGSVFVAQQDDPATTLTGAENPFDSLIAFYIVLKNKNLGVLVKVPAKVEPDPLTGQLVTTVDDTPQFPFSRFKFHFREGQRAPLITPPACGAYTTKAELTPWARPNEVVTKTASFQIARGVDGGPCPPGGVPPFQPDFEAGSLNNNAASYSPFLMRLLRRDGDQDMTKFSSVLPPGVLGKLAGVSKCSEAELARAQTKSGREELAFPSCPANSLIGHTQAGAGVGSALTFVGGKLYLARPYKGAPLSVAAITPGVAGPFDIGTVVVRVALTVNPKTGEVEVDGAASDPIPHILKGIVLKVRDLRVNVDRPEFTLNPTSCDESQARATLFGSFLDVFSPADDTPVALSERYQAANCSRLGFKPRLWLRLKGGTGRGAHPGLRALLRPRRGDANVERTVVRLPRSAFLDQGHIRTICTRVQFAADNCPKGAIYGHVRAFTPLLDEPLRGPVYLRSSNNKLPDLVFDLRGVVDVEASARIDSIRGGIRVSFTKVPDAPISKVLVNMQGGKKGLIVNSRNLCARPSRASVRLDGHNGRRATIRPRLRARCDKG